MRTVTHLLALGGSLGLSSPLWAIQGGPPDSAGVVRVQVLAAQEEAAPGSDLPIALRVHVEDGWHIWTNERPLPPDVSGFEGAVATELGADGQPSGLDLNLGFAQWPDFARVEADLGDGPKPYAVFEGDFTIFVPAVLAADASGEATAVLKLTLQACDESTCRAPATIRLPVRVGIAAGASSPPPPDAFRGFDPGVYAAIHSGESAPATVAFDAFGYGFSIDASGPTGLFVLALLAALGGFLLNFTPCVLPVIPLKIMSLAQSAGNPARCLRLGVAMSLGVLLFWVALGLAISLISGFEAANELFQYRPFTIGVGVFVAVMAIGMAGFFSLQLPQWVYAFEPKHDSYGGSLAFGAMTAVLSTPCTAPFMGSAAGWAATTGSAATVLTVFGAIGAGMAAPYLILAANPRWIDHMPRTGPASELIKQVMGLLMLAGAAYFVGSGVNGYLDEPSEVTWWFVCAFGVAAGGWLAWRTARITARWGRRVIFGGIGAGIVALSVMLGVAMTYDAIEWEAWTPEAEADALAEGQVVVLDFTAEWCLNCKALEKAVLESPAVAEQLNGEGVVPFRVDLTKGLPERRDRLTAAGRITIPLLVVIAPGGKTVFSSDAYTPAQVLAAIEAARAEETGGGKAGSATER